MWVRVHKWVCNYFLPMKIICLHLQIDTVISYSKYVYNESDSDCNSSFDIYLHKVDKFLLLNFTKFSQCQYLLQ